MRAPAQCRLRPRITRTGAPRSHRQGTPGPICPGSWIRRVESGRPRTAAPRAGGAHRGMRQRRRRRPADRPPCAQLRHRRERRVPVIERCRTPRGARSTAKCRRSAESHRRCRGRTREHGPPPGAAQPYDSGPPGAARHGPWPSLFLAALHRSNSVPAVSGELALAGSTEAVVCRILRMEARR